MVIGLRILLVYFSWTGFTRSVAEEVKRLLSARNHVDICEIVPVKKRSYLGWLMRSFIPGWRVDIQPSISDISRYDLLVIGSPKWTLGCPPVNEYLHRLRGVEGRRFAVFLTYGGFGEKRYLRRLLNILVKKGLKPSGWLLIKRRSMLQGRHEESVEVFCKQLEAVTGEDTASAGGLSEAW